VSSTESSLSTLTWLCTKLGSCTHTNASHFHRCCVACFVVRLHWTTRCVSLTRRIQYQHVYAVLLTWVLHLKVALLEVGLGVLLHALLETSLPVSLLLALLIPLLIVLPLSLLLHFLIVFPLILVLLSFPYPLSFAYFLHI